MTVCDEVLEKCKKHFNEIGLVGDTQVCRLVGYGADEDDCYYKVLLPSFMGGELKVVYHSAVGAWETLKDIYPRYERLERQFVEVWNCPLQQEFTNDWIGDSIGVE